jgi:hypothetical protein
METNFCFQRLLLNKFGSKMLIFKTDNKYGSCKKICEEVRTETSEEICEKICKENGKEVSEKVSEKFFGQQH